MAGKLPKKPSPKSSKDELKKVNENKPAVNRNLLNLIAGDIKGSSSLEDKEELKYTPVRMLSYNRASVYGGAAAGVIYEIKGPNGGGKTALGVEILASAQKAGHLTAFFDHERAANDKKWLTSLGLDLDNCIYRACNKDGKSTLTLESAAEEANDMIHKFTKAKREGKIPPHVLLYILWDSVAAAVPAAKVKEGAKVGDANYGLTARVMSDWLQTLNAIVGGSDVAFIFLNQLRSNVGAKPWEPKWKSFGGEALQFYSSIRIMVQHAGDIKEKVNDEEVVVGRKHRFKIEKNKLGFPAQEGMFYTSNGLGECELGFDDIRCVIEEAMAQGVIRKVNKTWYESDFFDKVNGERKVRLLLRDNPRIVMQIKEEINQMIKQGKVKLIDVEEGDEEDDE